MNSFIKNKKINMMLYISLSIASIIFLSINSAIFFKNTGGYNLFIISLVFFMIYGLIYNEAKFCSLYYFIFSMLFFLIEIIVKRTTGWDFHNVPFEIINIAMDTNIDEIKSASHFSVIEIIGLIIVSFSFLFSLTLFALRLNVIKLILNSILITYVFVFTINPVHASYVIIHENIDKIKNNAKIIEKKNNFKWGASSGAKDKQTVVIFLGETNRGDYLHFNGYDKQTTPELDKEKERGSLVSFKNSISQGPYTLMSTPMILTRKSVYDNGIYPEKSIISAYKEAGFKTWYVSYLSVSHIGDNEINLISNEADVYIQSDVNNSTLEKILSDTSDKKLIIYKTIGSHFLYQERYPLEYDVFKPSYKEVKYSKPSIEDKNILDNTYANSELYSVDKKVSDFIKILKKQDGLVYLSYISDHGTAIYDDGKSLYGGNTAGNYNIANFFWFNDRYISEHNEIIGKLELNKDKKITSECFIDTNFDISIIKTEKRKGCTLVDDSFIEKERLIRSNRVYNFDTEILN